LLPSDKLQEWIRAFPSLNNRFSQLDDVRYADLIDTIQQLIFNRFEDRLLIYLRELSELRGTPFVSVKHREISQNLGSAWEAVFPEPPGNWRSRDASGRSMRKLRSYKIMAMVTKVTKSASRVR
jgi:hypothetical protein